MNLNITLDNNSIAEIVPYNTRNNYSTQIESYIIRNFNDSTNIENIFPFNDNCNNINEEEFFSSSDTMIERFYINKKGNKKNNEDDDYNNYQVPKKGRHTFLDYDNILRKIQVDYISFIINFSNDVVRTLIGNEKELCFKDLDYNIKKTVSHKHIEELKKMTIGEIVQLKATTKVKKIDHEIYNKNAYKTILVICPSIAKFFKKSYISFFKEYYCNQNNILKVNGKIIPFSPATTKFDDLLKKCHSHTYKDRIKNASKKYSLNIYKNKKPIFKTYAC